MDYVTVPVNLSDGSTLLVEVAQTDDEQNVSRTNPFNFSEALKTIKGVVQELVAPLAELKLGKVTMEVSFGFEVEAGKIVSILANTSCSSAINIEIEFDTK